MKKRKSTLLPALLGQTRHVNIRGYVREIEVISSCSKQPDVWVVQDRSKLEYVNTDDFYHTHAGQLVARDIEFKRKYPTHPVHVESLTGVNPTL